MGYTFAFWLMWKIFDKVYHSITGEYKVDRANSTDCPQCEQRVKRIRDLKLANESLREEKRETTPKLRARKEAEVQLHRDKDELLAIKILNTAGEGTLEDIYGIGPVKTKRIMDARPFYSWHDVEKVVPGFKRYIISWAKKWEPSFTNHLRIR
jgi:hypothetical protein